MSFQLDQVEQVETIGEQWCHMHWVTTASACLCLCFLHQLKLPNTLQGQLHVIVQSGGHIAISNCEWGPLGSGMDTTDTPMCKGCSRMAATYSFSGSCKSRRTSRWHTGSVSGCTSPLRTKDRRSLEPRGPKLQSYFALLGVELKPVMPHPASPPSTASRDWDRTSMASLRQSKV